MDRRSFLQVGMAGVATAGMPVPMAHAAATYTPGQYAWAVATAQARDVISPDILVKSLKVSADQAAALMARLQARQVIGPQAASGAAKVVAPAFRASGLVGGRAISSAGVAGKINLPSLRQVAQTLNTQNVSPSDDDPDPQEASDEAHSAE